MDINKTYTIEELIHILEILRSENGCPWDREQTHETLKYYAVEEAWEVIDALEQDNTALLANELGDLLLQVVFQAQVAKEAGEFTFDDVVSEICRKLISRHTHIFGEDKAKTPEEVSLLWEKNKMHEKGLQSVTEAMREVPQSFPALMRAQKVNKKARKAGLTDQQSLEASACEMMDLSQEFAKAVAAGNKPDMEQKLGKLLFSITGAAEQMKAESEMLLQQETSRAIERFSERENEQN
jgi:tetrapyrrole methylase family protein/MazG family protein